ncbi:hypothetical protein RJT34_22871 [Clitoria ternatea]|uniref:Glabrous enhancer-binding protein-like DBD domain-containing protein n=1 Tax=Clitoria ternatea TaxID=43366 RepID=A0AAN9IFZ2_CLITE
MASHQHDVVYEDIDDDDETLEDEEEEEDEDDDVLPEPDDEIEPSPSTSSALPAVTIAATGDAAPIPPVKISVADSSPKQERTEQIEEKKALEDSRRLFQRLWKDEDEMRLLQGFLEYTLQRGSSHHNDTALFYDQIKSKLQLDFNKNQLVEKLRRLKKKYRNVLNKINSGKDFSFKSPHDRATFEISCRIWGNAVPIAGPVEEDDEINTNPNPNPNFAIRNDEKRTPLLSRKRSRSQFEKRELNDGSPALNKDDNCIGNSNNNNNNKDSENCMSRNNVQGLIEETVRSCLSPVLKELISAGSGGGGGMGFGFGGRGGFALNHMPMPFSFLNSGVGEMVLGDEKWRRQQILELEVYSKRLELVQDEIKVALDELRSAGGG